MRSLTTFEAPQELIAPAHGLSARVPQLDMPSTGWPVVVVRSFQGRSRSAAAVALVQAALARWGLAAIDGTDSAEALPACLDLDMPLINRRLTGIAELTDEGVRLAASAFGVTRTAFMEIDAVVAAEEVAMWFTEQLWTARPC